MGFFNSKKKQKETETEIDIDYTYLYEAQRITKEIYTKLITYLKNNEIKELSKLTRMDVDLNNCLALYFDFSGDLIGESEFFYKYIKDQTIRSIKDYIKDVDVWVDPFHMPEITVFKNEPFIEEIIDKDYNSKDGIIKFKGIIEKEVKIFRLYIRTNIFKKGK